MFFNAGPRPRQDRLWLYSYLVFLASSVVIGIYAIHQRNPNFAAVFGETGGINDPAACPIETHRRGLLQDKPEVGSSKRCGVHGNAAQ